MLQVDATPWELMLMERGLGRVVRDVLTPHWRALCGALSPGVVAYNSRRYVVRPRFRETYWKLRALTERRPLARHTHYTFITDVTFRSGEHVSTFSENFELCDDTGGYRLNTIVQRGSAEWCREYVYELEAEPLKSCWSPDFCFTAGDLEWNAPSSVTTATVHVLRSDGAMARLQMFNGGEGMLVQSNDYADGQQIDLPLELQFKGTLTSDERFMMDVEEHPDVKLSMFIGIHEESDEDISAPLVYCWEEGSTQERWQWQRSRRLNIYDRFNEEYGEYVPNTTLTVGAGGGNQASLPTRVRVLLDTLAWA